MPRKNLQDYTSIHVTKVLTRKLHRIGQHGESYEQIIWRLIKDQEKSNGTGK